MEAEVNQYGGNHVVMTNVMKEVKTKYVNIDTRFCRDYNTSPVASFTIDFPERIQKVRSINVTNVEFPLSFYNISKTLENTSFAILVTSGAITTQYSVTIPNGMYTNVTDLLTAITASLPIIPHVTIIFNKDIPPTTSTPPHIFFSVTMTAPVTKVEVLFAANEGMDECYSLTNSVSFDRYNIKSKLGWLLGFRQPFYGTNANATIYAEAMPDLNGPRYIYLAVDEFNNNAAQSTFVSMLPKSILNKNILARISIDSMNYASSPSSFGKVELANTYNGNIISDTRQYSDDVDLQRLQVQLVDEYGRALHLNGLDFAFSLCVKHT